MKQLLLFSAFIFSAAQFLHAQAPAIAQPPRAAQMGFTENKGQLVDQDGNPAPDVFFKSCGTGPAIYITNKGLTYVFDQAGDPLPASDKEETKLRMNWAKAEMQLIGADIRKENMVCEDALPGYSNFYYAHCPQGITNVKSYRHITIKNIYPNIDWVFSIDKKGLSHDFILHEGADVNNIRMQYAGTNEEVSLNKNNVLKISTDYGTIYEGGLKVYRKNSGEKVKSEFNLHNNILSFHLGKHSQGELIIDPPLQWSMPQASSNSDYGYSVAAAKDGSGDVLITGASDGTNFPVLNAYQGLLYGFEDMVVERLNAAGTRLWSTYYGGTDYEQGKSIVSDANGNCYVTGNTGSTNFPVLMATQPGYGGGVYDAAILKFDASGVRQWATWYGGLQNDYGTALTVDASGNVYVTGYTNSTAFPVVSALHGTKNIGYDAFILKLNTSVSVQWATFYGGDDDDKARAIAIDAAGSNVYVTGTTLSGGFPVTAGTFQTSSQSAYNFEDGFILKLSTAQAVQFCSYFGGADADFGQGITVNNSGTIFVTGYTLSGDFPIVNPGNGAYVDSTIGSPGTHDAFVLSCNATGTTQTWGTYFGGTMPDLGFAIAYDAAAGIYICGNTSSTDFPTHQPADNNFYQSVQGDGGTFNDMFIAWFGTNDSLKWSTYYGATTSDEAYGISVDASSNIFVTGVSNDDLEVLKFGPGFTTGVADPADPFIYAGYPVPCENNLAFDITPQESGTILFTFFNTSGQQVKEEIHELEAGHRGKFEFDLRDLPAGVYFLQMSTSAGKTMAYKFVKK
jgi:hypothetical protein